MDEASGLRPGHSRRRRAPDAREIQPREQRLSSGAQSPVCDERRSEGWSLVCTSRSRRFGAAHRPHPDDRRRLSDRTEGAASGAAADHAARRRRRSIRAGKISSARSSKSVSDWRSNPALSDEERKRLDKALKVLANATSYGIFAEMMREESAKKRFRSRAMASIPSRLSAPCSIPNIPASIASRRWRR